MEAKALEAKAMEAKAMEAKAMEAKAMEDKAVEVKAMEAKAMEAKAMGAKAMEEKVMEWKAKAMGAAALMATMVTAMAAAATTYFSSGPQDGRGCTTGCNRLLVGCVSGCTPRRRAGVRVRWRSSSVWCGRLSTSRSRRANLGGRVQWCRREEGRLHCRSSPSFLLTPTRICHENMPKTTRLATLSRIFVFVGQSNSSLGFRLASVYEARCAGASGIEPRRS